MAGGITLTSSSFSGTLSYDDLLIKKYRRSKKLNRSKKEKNKYDDTYKQGKRSNRRNK